MTAGTPPGLGDRLARPVCLACAALALALVAAGALLLVVETLRFFADVSPLRFFSEPSWTPLAEDPEFGIWPLLAGTAQIAAGATVVAVPPGLLTALFVEYHAAKPIARLAKGAVAVLAAVPTVVYGYLALTFLAPAIRSIWPSAEAFNALSACLAVAVMILPTIVAFSGRALAAVPDALFVDAVAVGESRSRVLIRLVLPAAAAGIAGSVVLALTRAVGETMIVTLAAGNPVALTWSPLEEVRTATAYLAQTSVGGLSAGTLEYRAGFAVALVLALATMALHAAGTALVHSRHE